MGESDASLRDWRLRRGERWALEVLQRFGRPLGEPTPEAPWWTFALEEPLARHLGRAEIRVTFRRRGADGAELAVAGSWLHDQLLRFSEGWGRAAAFFLPAAAADRRRILGRRRLDAALESLAERRYGALLEFSFRVFYYSEPVREDLVLLTVDTEQARVLRRACARSVFERAAPHPDPEFGPGPLVDVRGAFALAWRALEDEIEETARALEESGRPRVARELEIIERYYRQMIEEEKRLLKTRLSRRSREEGEHRLDLLKLDWERRVKEETDRLKPQVVASLRSVAVLFVPLELWRVAGGGGGIWLDLARGEAWRERGTNGAGGS